MLVSGEQALIVDGADEPERILDMVRRLTVTAIVETHNHADHVQALPALVEALNVPVYAHTDDPPPVPFTPIGEGGTLTIGDVTLTALHTPGHTPGSVCYTADGFLFSGDTLFPAGPGKTGDAEQFARIMGASTACSASSPTKRASALDTASTRPPRSPMWRDPPSTSPYGWFTQLRETCQTVYGGL